MTTVVRPPFYAPRPASEQLWSRHTRLNLPLALNLVPYQYGNQYFSYNDQSAWWYSRSIKTNIVLNATVHPSPFTTRQKWSFASDDSAMWSGPVETNQALTAVQSNLLGILPVGPFYVPNPTDDGDATLWSFSAQQNMSLTPVPFTSRQWSGFF